MNVENLSARLFFRIWLDSVINARATLAPVWQKSSEFTHLIFYSDSNILGKVASKLGLLNYNQYYSLDAILYNPEDKTPKIGENTYCFHDIRVAFEHENKFDNNLYLEVSHLLITNCDLRVLVTYPNESPNSKLDYMHEIISANRNSRLISDNESFLLILGYEANFTWEGFLYKTSNWEQICDT